MKLDESDSGLDVTVVIPAFNEAESLAELVPHVARVLDGQGIGFEVLVVDDGSSDDTVDVVTGLHAVDGRVGLLSLRRNFGKSAALKTGFEHAQGRYVITMDADLQDDPEELPLLIADLEGGLDLVSGWKRTRHDPISKTWPSRFFNGVVSRVTGIPLHDFNCGLKAYRAEVTRSVALYGEMHRFLPVLAHTQGFRVGEREVKHHARRYGQSKFGPARFVNGFLDLLEVVFLAGGSRTPLHVFGRVGTACLVLGGVINVYMFILWLVEGALRVRPLLLFGVILIILGIQFISIGLLAALIHAPASRERDYPLGHTLLPLGSDEGQARTTGSLLGFLHRHGQGESHRGQSERASEAGSVVNRSGEKGTE
ncbi:MAG: glycosyltransferase family 2 protein [Candidatus Eisenbacteria bacterium]|nr:glycosyltransferase family 2 protein [Candidatus Eisenbacteria bacterium]